MRAAPPVTEAAIPLALSFELLLDQHRAVMLVLDAETGRICYSNAAAHHFYGYTRAELLQKLIFDINQAPREQVRDAMNKVRTQGECRFTFPHQMANGSIRWIETHSTLVVLEGHEFLYSIIQDITERKQMELATLAGEQRYRLLYEHTPAMLHSIDPQGRLLSVSNTWLEKLGYERHEVIGRRSTDFLTDASRKYAHQVVLPAFFAQGEVHDIHYQLICKNGGTLDVLLSAISEHDPSGAVIRSLAVLTDITEQVLLKTAYQHQQAAMVMLFEVLVDPAVLVSAEGTVLRANQALAQWLGQLEPQHLYNQPAQTWGLWHEQGLQQACQVPLSQDESRYLALYPYSDPVGQAVGYLGILRAPR